MDRKGYVVDSHPINLPLSHGKRWSLGDEGAVDYRYEQKCASEARRADICVDCLQSLHVHVTQASKSINGLSATVVCQYRGLHGAK